MGESPKCRPDATRRAFSARPAMAIGLRRHLTLNTHRVLGDITAEEEALLSRFLDPDLYEGEPAAAEHRRALARWCSVCAKRLAKPCQPRGCPTRLPMPTCAITTGWKSQLEAAERLARIGAISENVLLRSLHGPHACRLGWGLGAGRSHTATGCSN